MADICTNRRYLEFYSKLWASNCDDPDSVNSLLPGPSTALLVAVLFIAVQIAESNFITLMVQRKLISIPSALIIIAQAYRSINRRMGLVLATPLMVIIIVLVQEVYIKRQTKGQVQE